MAGVTTQQGLRKALGALKDTTKLGLAKVNSEYKDLEIAVVKSTNHVECPPKDKHVRKIFAATSACCPRADVVYCVHLLARRLAKTRNWTVALKTLIVIHRTLRQGDPVFKEELLHYSLNRGHVLNLSNFKDDSSPVAWDCSAWVRTYALYLDEQLECFRTLGYDIESEQLSLKVIPGQEKGYCKARELDTNNLLEHLPVLQQVLHRLVGCQPEGAAVSNHVIQYALALVLKESFKLYCAINDGVIKLVDKFFDMARHDAIKVLDIYRRAGQQAESLSGFYQVCKGLELARNIQFPSLGQPPQSFLATMEEYVREAPRAVPIAGEALKFEEKLLLTYTEESFPSEDQHVATEKVPQLEPHSPRDVLVPASLAETKDLLNMDDAHPDPSAIEETNALALAIVTSGPASAVMQGVGDDAAGWELALVATSSNNDGTVNESGLAGGFDKLTLDSLYEDAMTRQAAYSVPGTHGISQYGNNPFESSPSLPSGMQDPFAVSNTIAPPPSVQMAAMAQQQEEIILQQQQTMPMHPATNPHQNNPFGDPFQVNDALSVGALSQHPHQNNPFGNPDML